MLKVSIITPLLLLAAFSAANPAHGNPHSGLSAVAVGHGLRVSLSIERDTYPLNALIPASVRLQNISSHPVALASRFFQACEPDVPWVSVTNRQGDPVYPPILRSYPIPGCPIVAPPSLRPGQAIQKLSFIILRDRYVEAGVALVRKRCCSWLDATVVTRPLVIQLTAEASPYLVVRSRPRAEAIIQPESPAQRGHLYFNESWMCRDQQGVTTSEVANWGLNGPERDTSHSLQRNRLTPGCAHPIRWDAVIGWLNHPVVTVDLGRG